MGNRRVKLPWGTVLAKGTAVTFVPVTPWMSTQGVRKARAQFEVRQYQGDLNIGVGYQLADVFDDPDSEGGNINPGQVSTNGYNFPTGYTTVDSGGDDWSDKAMVRFGWRSNQTTAGDPGFCRAGGVVELVSE